MPSRQTEPLPPWLKLALCQTWVPPAWPHSRAPGEASLGVEGPNLGSSQAAGSVLSKRGSSPHVSNMVTDTPALTQPCAPLSRLPPPQGHSHKCPNFTDTHPPAPLLFSATWPALQAGGSTLLGILGSRLLCAQTQLQRRQVMSTRQALSVLGTLSGWGRQVPRWDRHRQAAYASRETPGDRQGL